MTAPRPQAERKSWARSFSPLGFLWAAAILVTVSSPACPPPHAKISCACGVLATARLSLGDCSRCAGHGRSVPILALVARRKALNAATSTVKSSLCPFDVTELPAKVRGSGAPSQREGGHRFANEGGAARACGR